MIVEVRPAGEPARISCSALGSPRRDWTPLRVPVVVIGLANDAVASFARNEAKSMMREP